MGPWPPFGLRFPMFFPTLPKKHFVRRNGLFSFFQPTCPCFSALFQLPQILPRGGRANQLRFTKQDSKSRGGDTVRVRPPLPAPKTRTAFRRFLFLILIIAGVEPGSVVNEAPVGLQSRAPTKPAGANRPPLPAPFLFQFRFCSCRPRFNPPCLFLPCKRIGDSV